MGLYYNNLMLKLEIPGRGVLYLEHLVTDVNGTIAIDGELINGVKECIQRLRGILDIHIVTANTHGRQHIIDDILLVKSTILKPGNEAYQKAEYVNDLGCDKVIAIGQGVNDAGMLETAAIGISVISKEGLSFEALKNSDLIVPDILTAFALIENPKRIIASLRK